jgi:hypothetical protein
MNADKPTLTSLAENSGDLVKLAKAIDWEVHRYFSFPPTNPERADFGAAVFLREYSKLLADASKTLHDFRRVNSEAAKKQGDTELL